MRGVKEWKNRKNTFTVFRLHYSADPNKNPRSKAGAAWVEKVLNPLKTAHRKQEYEINFTIRTGKAVYPQFNAENHVGYFSAPPHSLIVCGWDFGHHHPAAVFCYDNTFTGRFEVLECLLGRDINFPTFSAEVMAFRQLKWSHARFIEAPDPHGAWVNAQGMITEGGIGAENPVQYLRSMYGCEVYVDNQAYKPSDARELLGDIMAQRPVERDEWPFGVNDTKKTVIWKREPRSMIQAGTEYIVEGLGGGYDFPRKADGTYAESPNKGLYSHGCDALLYAFIVMRMNREIRREEAEIFTEPPMETDEMGVAF